MTVERSKRRFLILIVFIAKFFKKTSTYNKQLLDEVDHDIMNYQN